MQNIGTRSGITQTYEPSRIPKSLLHQEHEIILTIPFESSQNGVITLHTNDAYSDIYQVDIPELLVAAASGATYTGTSLYLYIDGFSPPFTHSYVTYLPDGTTQLPKGAIAIVPGVPGIFEKQRYATWKNGEGNIKSQFTITCKDMTGKIIPIIGMIRFAIKTLRW